MLPRRDVTADLSGHLVPKKLNSNDSEKQPKDTRCHCQQHTLR